MSEVVNYRDVIDCPYAQKHWVSPKDVNKEIPYEEGTFGAPSVRKVPQGGSCISG